MLHDVNERLGRELPALQDRVRKARALCVLLCLLVLLGASLALGGCEQRLFTPLAVNRCCLAQPCCTSLARASTSTGASRARPAFASSSNGGSHRSPTRTGPCTLNAVPAPASSSVESRGASLALAPPPRVCGEVHPTCPHLRWQGRTRGRLLAALCWLDCTMLALLALLLCTAVVLASRRAFEQPQIAPPPPPYTCDCSWTETYSCPGTASPPPPPPPPAAFRFSLDEATWRDAFGDVSDLFHPHATPDHSHCFAFCCPGGTRTRGFWSLVPKSFRTGLLFGGEGA